LTIRQRKRSLETNPQKKSDADDGRTESNKQIAGAHPKQQQQQNQTRSKARFSSACLPACPSLTKRRPTRTRAVRHQTASDKSAMGDPSKIIDGRADAEHEMTKRSARIGEGNAANGGAHECVWRCASSLSSPPLPRLSRERGRGFCHFPLFRLYLYRQNSETRTPLGDDRGD